MSTFPIVAFQVYCNPEMYLRQQIYIYIYLYIHINIQIQICTPEYLQAVR